MDIEILETKLFVKKRQISIMVDDVKMLEKAATVLRSIGYDDSEVKRASSSILDDIKKESKEAVRIHNKLSNAIERHKERIKDMQK